MNQTNVRQWSDELNAELTKLAATKDIDEAKVIARAFLQSCHMQKTIPKKLEELESMTRIDKIVSLCYNTLLSGEGLKVVK